MQSKNVLRAWLKSKRLAMPKPDIRSKSQEINKQLLGFLKLDQIKTISCYRAIESLNEVDTKEFLTLLKKYPNITLVLQSQEEKISEEYFDLIIVPVLGFDGLGNRIGWGGGFYDKFLANQPKALKIGLCFEAMKVKTTFSEPHDIKLDAIITESRIYQFR